MGVISCLGGGLRSLSAFLVVITSAKEVGLSQGGNVFAFVCLLATLLKKFLTDFDEIFRIARQRYKEQFIKFWG